MVPTRYDRQAILDEFAGLRTLLGVGLDGLKLGGGM